MVTRNKPKVCNNYWFPKGTNHGCSLREQQLLFFKPPWLLLFNFNKNSIFVFIFVSSLLRYSNKRSTTIMGLFLFLRSKNNPNHVKNRYFIASVVIKDFKVKIESFINLLKIFCFQDFFKERVT